MIAALLTGFAASPWTRAALRYGAVALAVDLSRICAAPGARLGHLAFEGQGAFSSQC